MLSKNLATSTGSVNRNTAQPITMTVQKNGTFSNVSDIYLVLYGEQNGNFIYYDWPSSTWKAAVANQAFTNLKVSIKNSPTQKTLATLQVPYVAGARLYFSLDQSLSFVPSSPTQLTAPTPWDSNSPFHSTPMDKFEFTTDEQNGLSQINCNTTCVDYFSIPIQFKIKGFKGATTQSQVVTYDLGITAKRADIYNGLSGEANFKKLIQGPAAGATAGNFYRIVSPNCGISKINTFPANYLDAYITNAWNNVFGVASNPPTILLENINPNVKPVGVPTWKYTGKMNGNSELQFTCSNAAGGNPPFVDKATVTVPMPNTEQVFLNELKATATPISPGTQTDADNAKNFVTAQLGAAICRTVFHMVDSNNESGMDLWSQYANFYKQTTIKFKNQATNDFYSKVLHDNSIDNKCYSIPFSDQYDYSSFASVFSPTEFTVTLNDQ